MGFFLFVGEVEGSVFRDCLVVLFYRLGNRFRM